MRGPRRLLITVIAVIALLAGVALGMGAVSLLLAGGDAAGEDTAREDTAAGEEEATEPSETPEQPSETPGDSDPGAPGDGPVPSGPTTVEEPEPSHPPAPDVLIAHLGALLDREEVRAIESLSVLVADEEGREMAALSPDGTATPASTTKLVTAAAALRLLGPDYRYVTRVFTAGERSGGVIDGDLVLVGSGDPALASPAYMENVYPARPHTDMDSLAAAIEAAGITEVRGSVLGDQRLFADEPVAEGWVDRYFSSLNTTHASGLTVDAGRRLVERDDTLHAEVADEPALLAAEVLAELLEERGVEVTGDPGVEGLPDGAEELARVRSRPLGELLTHVVQRSDNHMADGVFRTLGALAGSGTWSDSDRAVRAALADLDVDWSDAVLRDGSGLSREDLLTARILVEIDRHMTEQRSGDWEPLMAVAGESGTLRGRLRGTPADGRLRGKTGALRDARALAGQVASADGRRYHFAVLGSDLNGGEIATVRAVMDEIALLLADDPPGCLPAELDEDGHCG